MEKKSVQTFMVWQFRVRFHFKKHGDTKKSRAALMAKFTPEERRLVDSLIESYDADEAYRLVREQHDRNVHSVLPIEDLMHQTESLIESFGETYNPSKLPPAVRKQVDRTLASWSKSRDALQAVLKPFERKGLTLHNDLLRLDRVRTNALAKARAAYAHHAGKDEES